MIQNITKALGYTFTVQI